MKIIQRVNNNKPVYFVGEGNDRTSMRSANVRCNNGELTGPYYSYNTGKSTPIYFIDKRSANKYASMNEGYAQKAPNMTRSDLASIGHGMYISKNTNTYKRAVQANKIDLEYVG